LGFPTTQNEPKQLNNAVFCIGTLSAIQKGNNYVMSSLNDFQSSSFDGKCNFIMIHSDYLAMRKLDDCNVYLYHTGEFFIEVCYSPLYKKVVMINAFDDQVGLMNYAENISLDDLKLRSKI